MVDVSDNELLQLIVKADDAAMADGVPPKARWMLVAERVMRELGITEFVMAGRETPPLVKRINQIHQSLYRPSDLAVGGIHGGVFMFRDIFARVYVPIVYGRVSINPFALTDLAPVQIEWLQSRHVDCKAFLKTFVDVFDFGGGVAPLAQFKTPPKEALEIFRLASFQFQASAATLSAAFSFAGAVQSALIGTELALKAGLAVVGHNEKSRRDFGHDLSSAAKAFSEANSGFDLDQVSNAISQLPPYVANRYATVQPGRMETGRIVMSAQFVAGEVMRQVTGFSIASAMQ